MMVFRSCIIFIFISFLFSAYGQNTFYNYIDYNGDTIQLMVIQSPTVCDCLKKDYRNEGQAKICNRVYDYDFMSEKEKKDFDEQSRICHNPSICDCALADLNDLGLISSCDRIYNRDDITANRKKEILEEMTACINLSNGKNLEICDCINVSNFAIREQCDKKYFQPDFSTEKKEEIGTAIKNCIDENQYAFSVSVCDCAQFSKSDSLYRKACNQRFNPLKMDSLEQKKYYDEIAFCSNSLIIDRFIDSLNISKDSIIYTICECMDVENKNFEKKQACLNQWNFATMNESQIIAYKEIAKNCGNTYQKLDICFCMFKVYELNDPGLLKKCEKYLNSIPESELEKYFSQGVDCFE